MVTVYLIGILIAPIIIMLIFRFFPDLKKKITDGTDFEDFLFICALILLFWPFVFVFTIIIGFYYACYWLINLGKHKK